MKRLPISPAAILFAAALFSVSTAHAHDPAADAATQADTIQREQERTRPQTLPVAPDGVRPTPPVPSESEEGEHCVDVQSVSVTGVSLIRPGRLSDALAAFEDRCLGVSEINSVLEAITFLYVEKGYITSRAYLPEQDLSDGSLEVVVVEGQLEATVMNGDPGASPGSRATAFPGMLGEPLNLRDIEQGLEQLGRLRSVDASMEISAGSDNGASILQVNRQQGRPWYATITADNLGSVSTGEYRTRLNLGYDNLFGLNDALTGSYQRSRSGGVVEFSGDRPSANAWTAKLEIPYGYWTFAMDGSHSRYRSRIAGQISQINTSGNSTNVTLSAAHVLHRDQISKTTLTGSLNWKDNKSFILDALIDVSSRSLSVASLDTSHARQLWGGQGTASLGVHQGIDLLGAPDDGRAPPGSPAAQFQKIDLTLFYSRFAELAGQQIAYDGRVSAQWTDDLLFGSEQMSLDGHPGARSSDLQTLFGNRAVTFNTGLSLRFPAPENTLLATYLGRLEPYIAYEIGHVRGEAEHGIQGGTLSGAAIGLRNLGGKAFLDLSYADLISVPGHLSSAKERSGLVSVTLSFTF